MAHRYSDMAFILSLDIESFHRLFLKAREEEQKEFYHRQYCTYLPWMSQEIFKSMTFNEYYDKCTGANIDTRPTSEIINEIKQAHGGHL